MMVNFMLTGGVEVGREKEELGSRYSERAGFDKGKIEATIE